MLLGVCEWAEKQDGGLRRDCFLSLCPGYASLSLTGTGFSPPRILYLAQPVNICFCPLSPALEKNLTVVLIHVPIQEVRSISEVVGRKRRMLWLTRTRCQLQAFNPMLKKCTSLTFFFINNGIRCNVMKLLSCVEIFSIFQLFTNHNFATSWWTQCSMYQLKLQIFLLVVGDQNRAKKVATCHKLDSKWLLMLLRVCWMCKASVKPSRPWAAPRSFLRSDVLRQTKPQERDPPWRALSNGVMSLWLCRHFPASWMHFWL